MEDKTYFIDAATSGDGLHSLRSVAAGVGAVGKLGMEQKLSPQIGPTYNNAILNGNNNRWKISQTCFYFRTLWASENTINTYSGKSTDFSKLSYYYYKNRLSDCLGGSIYLF